MAKTQDEAYAEVLAKYERAQQHIRDLETCLIAFRNSIPYGIVEERDLESGDIIYRCSKVTALPAEIALILGDALHNLRSTLDYLVYKMVERSGATPDSRTGFPIFDDAKGYASLKAGKIKGLGKLAIEAIDRLQPYKGGNSHLWVLHQLDIRDKHRLLLAVDHSMFGHRLLPAQIDQFSSHDPANSGNAGTYVPHDALQPFPVPFPLNVGYKLMTVSRQYTDLHIGFVIDVAINEPGVVEGSPLELLLSNLRDEVGLVIRDLAQFV